MFAPLNAQRAQKGKGVFLQYDLPLGFGNKNPIRRQPGTKGYIESDGF